MKNLCGKCNVCCVIYRIDKKFLSWRDTDKAKGEICDKLINDRCVRYSSRPKLCKNFVCLWLKLSKEGMNNPEWRPDRLGFVVRTKEIDNKSAFVIEEIEQGSLNFKNMTTEQDSFLKRMFELMNGGLILIKPFGHDKAYPLNFIPD